MYPNESEMQVETGLARPFVSAPYVEEDGRWRPVEVRECPYGEGCRITGHVRHGAGCAMAAESVRLANRFSDFCFLGRAYFCAGNRAV